ncbi:enoyl-CoA hydratase [Massilia terrae]|uniref:Enoyl-CoA hydratase n=1 Tax=Massilia terrae TaxID=1811224 RepID=A0ABT2CX86_9BURK|nr:enoyl-CoA hydratase [Massilia terrae]MCS0658602.1 enoyl-CoA hydratase [Massilia terrae]
MEILSTKADGILAIEFNRAERKNAITSAMYQAMADALFEADRDTAVRAVLITGKPEIFTAGNDLEDFLKSAALPMSEDRPVFQFMRALSGISKPVVAAVSGAAIGIGTTLLLHCDLVYCADNAKFSLPFSQLGLCPEFASSLLLPQLAGYPRAAEKLLLGEAFGAQEAYEMGLVSKVLPVAELPAFARQQAAKLVALPAASIRMTKSLMKRPRQQAIDDTLAFESKQFAAMLQGAEAKEAFTAFFEKRKPDFSKFD